MDNCNFINNNDLNSSMSIEENLLYFNDFEKNKGIKKKSKLRRDIGIKHI